MNDNDNQEESTGAMGAPQSFSDRVRSLRLPDRPARQTSGNVWLPWTLCALLLAVVAGLAGFTFFREDKDYQEYVEFKKNNPDPKAALSKMSKAREEQANAKDPEGIALESKGYIIPISLIQVSPKVGGMVTKLYITEGMRVKKDFLLAELEDVDYKYDCDRAHATLDELWKYREQEIKQAEADWAECKAQREQLALDYLRSRLLKESNALPIKDFEQAESAYKAMEFRTERLKLALDLLKKGQRDEKIAAAKADLDKAQWRLDNTRVKAPIEGIILSKKAEEGNMVNPSAFSNGLSASLCEMADLTRMEVDLAIAERDISKVFEEQECVVRSEAYLERPYVGWVSRLMPTGDRSKGSVPVRVQIRIPRAEEGQFLRPEMGAIVTFFNKKINPDKK